LRAFSIQPVILVRNIFDCIVSLKDHIDKGLVDPDTRIGPVAYVPDAYYEWTADARLDFIVDLFSPWYFNFFVGWQDFDDGVWVRYEDLLADPRATVRHIADALTLGVGDEAIAAAVDAAAHQPTRRNVATVGRGGMLSKQQRRRIEHLATYYPGKDFSLIGIG
jgi:hypothetical protein